MEMEKLTKILGNISELDPNKKYVFNIDVGDMNKDNCIALLTQVKNTLDEFGIKCVYVPTRDNGVNGGLITVDEWLKENK